MRACQINPLPPGTCDASPRGNEGGPPWHWEAHVAEEVFVDLLREAGVEVFLATRILAVGKDATRGAIENVTTNASTTITARAFVDGSCASSRWCWWGW